jgi:hypothetical protein
MAEELDTRQKPTVLVDCGPKKRFVLLNTCLGNKSTADYNKK